MPRGFDFNKYDLERLKNETEDELVKFSIHSTGKCNCINVNHCWVENSFCPRAPETCLLA